MAEKVYTQQEFANLAGISTATVGKLLKEGAIKRDVSGHIPEIELEKYYINSAKKYAVNGILIVSYNTPDEALNTLKSDMLQALKHGNNKKNPVYISSFSSLIKDLLDDRSSDINRDKEIIKQTKYNKKILHLFITKYKDYILNTMCSMFNDENYEKFMELSFKDLFSLLAFVSDTVPYSDNEVFIKQLEDFYLEADKKFECLMQELNLVDSDNKPIFSREAITQDFLTERGSLYDSFFSDKNGRYGLTELHGYKKLTDSMSNANIGHRFKENLDKKLSDGYVTIVNLLSTSDVKNFNTDDVDIVTSLIMQGFYKTIMFTCKEEEFSEKYPIDIVRTVNMLAVNNIINTVFCKEE